MFTCDDCGYAKSDCEMRNEFIDDPILCNDCYTERENEMTVAKLIDILSGFPSEALVVNVDENVVRVFAGKENKANGRRVVMIL